MKLSNTKVLSEKEINDIDNASKEILEETGIKVLSKEVLKIYEKAGAKVNYNEMIVKIPEEIINRCIRSVPKEFKVYERCKDSYLNIGNNLGYCASGHNAIYMFDSKTQERRPVTKTEVGNFAKISDALPKIHIVGVQAMPQDVFYKSSILHSLDAVLNNTSKPIYFSPENILETIATIEMLEIISQGEDLAERPIGICQLSPISPLTWSKGTALAVVEIAKSGIPLSILPEPYSGVTSPYTLAGTLVVNNIEILSGIVLSQTVNEGCPIMYAASWTTFDMNKGTVLIGTPESGLLGVAEAQIAKYYGLPSHTTAFNTDSNLCDEQNSFEKMFNLISSLQSGINLIVNAGMFATGMTVSYEQLVVDHEIATFVYRYLEGIQISEDAIAKEVIKRIGPGNNYMMDSHTLKHIHTNEHSSYKVSNRDVYDIWKNLGKPSIIDNAKKVAEEIIKDHKPKLLHKDDQEKLKEIINNYENKFKK